MNGRCGVRRQEKHTQNNKKLEYYFISELNIRVLVHSSSDVCHFTLLFYVMPLSTGSRTQWRSLTDPADCFKCFKRNDRYNSCRNLWMYLFSLGTIVRLFDEFIFFYFWQMVLFMHIDWMARCWNGTVTKIIIKKFNGAFQINKKNYWKLFFVHFLYYCWRWAHVIERSQLIEPFHWFPKFGQSNNKSIEQVQTFIWMENETEDDSWTNCMA